MTEDQQDYYLNLLIYYFIKDFHMNTLGIIARIHNEDLYTDEHYACFRGSIKSHPNWIELRKLYDNNIQEFKNILILIKSKVS